MIQKGHSTGIKNCIFNLIIFFKKCITMKTALFIFFMSFSLALVAQVGRVGINTNAPSAMLHVKDSSVLFTGPTSLPASAGATPVSGNGNRFMWYADKAALRSGGMIGLHWDKDSIGNFSVAMGTQTKAKGSVSTAFGNSTTASGSVSTAMGGGTIASGTNSTASGFQTIASGINSFASGDGTEASGQWSFAAGVATNASGLASVAMGNGPDAAGRYSTALGYGGKASGDRSIKATGEAYAASFHSMAIGRFNDTTAGCSPTLWVDTDPLFSIGNGIGFFDRNNAMTVLKNGRTGVNTASPKAMMHVLLGNSINGPIHSNAAAVIEADQSSFLQLSNINSGQSGILAGNEVSSIRSALIFTVDSAINLRTGGNNTRMSISKDGNTNFSGEVRRTATGSANVVPICFGSVDAAGNILSGTGNFTVALAFTGVYELTITGETYINSGYISNVTPVQTSPRFVSTTSSAGKFVVRLFNSASALTDTPFQFVVYKP
jgi:hypothetical protein